MAGSPPSKRAREIFEHVVDLSSEEERLAYLKNACGSDAALLDRVQALMAANDAAISLLPDAAENDTMDALVEGVGDVIGRYKLLEKIGEGGMGVVYMAEQLEPVRRRVALKIIKLGMDTRQVVARFEAERQALALMDHPNIARILDAGVTGQLHPQPLSHPMGEGGRNVDLGPQEPHRAKTTSGTPNAPPAGTPRRDESRAPTYAGRPYFVMELVQGVPITEFCERNQLSVEDRLKLFIPVCQAIQSAHQKGIVHRDLKPSNVLVTLHDGKPVPKVIDFGVAKAIHQKLTEKTLFTNFATMIGTPAYMSPEQAEMSGLDVDTRSDIYSLGVLLYELLTGTTPFPEKRLRSVSYSEMQRILLEEEPERPSTRLHKAALAPSLLVIRHSSLATDLDWIVMKCLEKDRNRRYETANGLAADLQRHLTNEPIAARPPSSTYRIRKFVRRHQVASLATVLVTLAVIVGAAVATGALIRERAARVREQTVREQASQRLNAALTFVNQVLTNVGPEIRLVAGAARAQEALLQAGLGFMQRLRESASDEPAARVALARLLLYMSERQNPGEPNTVGAYEVAVQRAGEALQLLSAETSQLSEIERLKLIYQGNFARIGALFGLARWDEGIRRSQEIESVLDQLELFPEHARRARRDRMLIRHNVGWATFLAGQPGLALTNHILPVLRSDWARGITNESNDDELHVLQIANDLAANCHGLLKDFRAMLPPAREALRLSLLLKERNPGNAFHSDMVVQCRAWLGYALMRTGDPNAGLAALAQSLGEAEAQAKTQSSSESFRRIHVIIVSLHALAYAGWSGDSPGSLKERRERLTRAEAYLAEAEQLDSSIKSKTGALPAARAEVTAARAALEALERAQANPEASPQP